MIPEIPDGFDVFHHSRFTMKIFSKKTVTWLLLNNAWLGTVEVLWPEDKRKDYPRKLLPIYRFSLLALRCYRVSYRRFAVNRHSELYLRITVNNGYFRI
jgi:hypothetical protein